MLIGVEIVDVVVVVAPCRRYIVGTRNDVQFNVSLQFV